MFIYYLLQMPIWRIYDLWSSEQTHVSVFLTHPVLFCQETILLRPYFLPFVSRKDHPISVGIFHLAGTDGMTPDLQREPVDSPSEPWRFNNLSHPCSNTSLKVWKTHLSHFVTVPGRRLWSDARRWLKNFPEIGPVTSWILTSRKKRWWKFGCSKHPREGTFLLKKEWLSVFRISSVCVCGLQPRNQRKWYHPGACLEPHWGGDRVTSHCCRWKPGCRAPPWILMTALMSIHLLSAHCSVVVWSFYYEVQRLLNLPLLDSFFSHILNNIVPVQRSVQLKVKCSQHLMFSLTTGTITTSWTSSPSLQINKSNLMFCSSASWFERFQSFITVSTPALKARSKESWVRCPEDPHITNAASCG